MNDDGYRIICDLCGMLWSNDPHAWLGPKPPPCQENGGGPHIEPVPEITGETWREAKRAWYQRVEDEFDRRLGSAS